MVATLPEFQVLRSAKAKNLRLKVTRADGLTVVVPRGFDVEKIPALLKRKSQWIASALERVGETKRFLEREPVAHLPECLVLLALGETWRVSYSESDRRPGVWLRIGDGELQIVGDDLSRQKVIRRLNEWLRSRVREALAPLAEQLAVRHKLRLRGVLVKSQRTRWASCSARGNLSLNTKLLFLRPELVRYVIVHELCHTVHMNHSGDFWRLLQAHEPQYKVLDHSLREAWKSIPHWMLVPDGASPGRARPSGRLSPNVRP